MFLNHEIEQIAEDERPVLAKTPTIFSPYLSELTNAKVYLKLENMQQTSSFKERGALNFLLKHQAELSHVVTASAGNHAQALALHAGRLAIAATIFMPLNTPNNKVTATENLKASVVLMGDNYDEAYAAACKFVEESGARYVHAYDDLDVIKGQATVAYEIFSQVNDVDAIFVPVGGGGLISGIAQYAANLSLNKGPKIIGVEAADYESMASALNKGKMTGAFKKTIAEGIAVRKIGQVPHQICQVLKPELTSVTDLQIENTIDLLLERQRIVVEGAGAASVAAFLSEEYRHSFVDKTVVLIISGGNIDISLLARLTANAMVKTHRLCRMSMVINDRPGSLARLLSLVTKAKGNIIDIRHERLFADLKWNEVLVDLTIEIKNEMHEKMLLNGLLSEGYLMVENKPEINCGLGQ